MSQGIAPNAGLDAKPRLMLHVCCAPDATVVVERCREHFDLACFFYDPNIHPYAEYRKRADEMRRFAEEWGIVYYEGAYDASRFFDLVKGLESELEKGKRCDVCFDMRLEETARLAWQEGYGSISTVLTTSPKKDADLINGLGRKAAANWGLAYLDEDWKKEGGYNRSVELARELNMFRQNYCGCEFSRVEREIEARVQAKYTAKRSGMESAGPRVMLYARVTDDAGRIMLVKEEGAWHLPNLESAIGHKSRDRLRNLFRQGYRLKVSLEGEPDWIEECLTQGPDRRHDHVLFFGGRLTGTVDGTPPASGEQVRWLDAAGMSGYKLGPTTAALLSRR